jgi:uncharacterized protein YfaS (alpha-2-macroglobulin family)
MSPSYLLASARNRERCPSPNRTNGTRGKHWRRRYLAFEDLKPAGCEPVELRSGERAGQEVCSNFELRDQKVVFFLSNLTQGRRSLSYRLRAEAPGAFHAMPTNGYAMYAPALRTLSAEQTITVKDE